MVAVATAAAGITDRLTPDRSQRRGWLHGGRPLRPSGRWILPAIVALGVALRLLAVLARRPLWLDEAMLARPIIARPLATLLTEPLPDGQVAPIGFLALERLAIDALGTGEVALRVVPLLASLLTIPLGIALARRAVPARGVAFAVLLIAVAHPLIVHAADAKPYASDVAIALALTVAWLATRDRGAPRAAVATVAVGAALAVWCSIPAILVLAGLTAATLLVDRHATAPATRRRLALGAVLWVPSGALATWTAWHRVSASDRQYLHDFWTTGFWHWPPTTIRDLAWPIIAPASALDRLLVVPPGLVWLALAIAGVVAAWSVPRLRAPASAMAGPAIVCGAAAFAALYPLADRLVLFLVPAGLLLVAIAVTRLADRAPAGATILGAALVLAQLALAVTAPHHEDVRTLEQAVESRRRPGDAVYVYYAAGPTYSYYHTLEHRTTPFDVGGCHRSAWRDYLRDVDRYAGRPIWLVVAHPFDAAGVREDSALTAYLGARRRATITVAAEDGFARRYEPEDRSGVPADSTPVPAGARTARRPIAGRLACRAATSAGAASDER